MMFERVPLLVAAPVVAVVVAILAVVARRQRVRAAAAWSRTLGDQARAWGHRSPWVLAAVALVAAVGVAGPRWGIASSTTESRALNIVVVMDVSRSMLAQDVAPNRLGHAVSLARRLVQDLDGDRFALVAFAGHAYALSPLTLDASSISLQLDALDPEMASFGGSGLGAGLEVARHILVSSPQGGDRAIVVFTDGETFEPGSAMAEAGRALGRAGITVIGIPVGTVEGTRIPEPGGGWHVDPMTGREVVTARRDDLLQAVTDAAHGVLIPASVPDPVGDARRALSRLNRSLASDRTAADMIPRGWIFALVAVLLLLAQTLTRRSAALIGIVLVMGVHAASAQRLSTGNRLLNRGDTARARQAFAADAKTLTSDTALFNAGTSALLAGDWAVAAEELQRASLSFDPALRQRAVYNLGTALLMQSRRDTAQRDTLLADASRWLREALLLSPGDRNAKFNYELARRLRPPPKASSGGGKSKPGAPQPQPPARPSSGGRGGMTPAEADQVLNAMERAERQTRLSQYQRARRGEPPSGPDW